MGLFPEATPSTHLVSGSIERFTADTPGVRFFDACPVNADGTANPNAKEVGSKVTRNGQLLVFEGKLCLITAKSVEGVTENASSGDTTPSLNVLAIDPDKQTLTAAGAIKGAKVDLDNGNGAFVASSGKAVYLIGVRNDSDETGKLQGGFYRATSRGRRAAPKHATSRSSARSTTTPRSSISRGYSWTARAWMRRATRRKRAASSSS